MYRIRPLFLAFGLLLTQLTFASCPTDNKSSDQIIDCVINEGAEQEYQGDEVGSQDSDQEKTVTTKKIVKQ